MRRQAGCARPFPPHVHNGKIRCKSKATHQQLEYELNGRRLLHPWRLLQQRLLCSGRCEDDKCATQRAQAHYACVRIFVLGCTFKDAVALPSSIRRQAWISRLYTIVCRLSGCASRMFILSDSVQIQMRSYLVLVVWACACQHVNVIGDLA